MKSINFISSYYDKSIKKFKKKRYFIPKDFFHYLWNTTFTVITKRFSACIISGKGKHPYSFAKRQCDQESRKGQKHPSEQQQTDRQINFWLWQKQAHTFFGILFFPWTLFFFFLCTSVFWENFFSYLCYMAIKKSLDLLS